MELVERQDAQWGLWFREHGIARLEVAYEDLDRDPAATVNAVLNHLGVRADVGLVQPSVKRQADRLTEQYVERHRQLGRL